MKKIIVNLILLIAMAVIGIMIAGSFLYNYIPNDVTVAKAKTYEVNTETTKVLSDAAETTTLLSQLTGSSNSEEAVKTTIILQTHQVTSSDLDVFQRSGAYKKGKADPFDEPTEEPVSGDPIVNPGNPSNPNIGNGSDGTFFGTGNQK